MRAGGTVRHMGWREERDGAVIAAYAEGRPVADIGREYGLTPEQVEQIVGGPAAVPTPSRRGFRNTGNRAALAIGVGFVVQVFAGLLGAEAVGRVVLWAVVAVITYAAVTAAAR